MKIAAYTHYYIEQNKAGGEIYLHTVLKELAKDHEVTAFITENFGKNTQIDGINVVYGAVRKDIESFNFDLIVAQFSYATTAIEVAHKKGKRVALILHNDSAESTGNLKLLNENDIAIFNTHWVKQPTKAIELVIHPQISKDIITSTGKEFITFVNPQMIKGSALFYQIADRMPQFKFLVVEGGYAKEAQALLERPNITIQKQTDNMRDDVYARTRVLLMPSLKESYGMVAREAGMSGIPVICRATAGLRENLGDSAIYCGNDVNSWVRAILQLTNSISYRNASAKIKNHCLTTHQNELKQLTDLLKDKTSKKSEKPRLSVLIPVYNQEDLVFKAINSVPDRPDIEIVICDDKSTDNTLDRLKMAFKDNPRITILENEVNKGVGYTSNRCIDEARGEYICQLDSDDYFLPEFNQIIDNLDGTDITYFDLRINSGDIWELTPRNRHLLCGQVKVIRREFVGDTRNPELRANEDAYFTRDLLKKNPTEKYSKIVAKHYNFPRVGSLTYLKNKGEI